MQKIRVRPELPIECRCSHRHERFQLAFARKAMEFLPHDEEIAFEPTARGLTVLAGTEMALERPLRRLREVYGDEVRIEPPAVRYHQGPRLEEPHMGLRVLCAPEHFNTVRRDLDARRASVMDAEVNRRFGIVRASAPLAALFGFPDRLAHITSGHGQLVMWLSHYAPLEEPPPGGDAA